MARGAQTSRLGEPPGLEATARSWRGPAGSGEPLKGLFLESHSGPWVEPARPCLSRDGPPGWGPCWVQGQAEPGSQEKRLGVGTWGCTCWEGQAVQPRAPGRGSPRAAQSAEPLTHSCLCFETGRTVGQGAAPPPGDRGLRSRLLRSVACPGEAAEQCLRDQGLHPAGDRALPSRALGLALFLRAAGPEPRTPSIRSPCCPVLSLLAAGNLSWLGPRSAAWRGQGALASAPGSPLLQFWGASGGTGAVMRRPRARPPLLRAHANPRHFHVISGLELLSGAGSSGMRKPGPGGWVGARVTGVNDAKVTGVNDGPRIPEGAVGESFRAQLVTGLGALSRGLRSMKWSL